MEELAALLDRERVLLELLLFRLVETRHLLQAGDTRFLSWAATDLERAARRVREAELQRAVAVVRLAEELGMPQEQVTLAALAREAPEPYRSLFAEHRRAFTALVAEVQTLAIDSGRLAGDGADSVAAVLTMLGGGDRSESEVRSAGDAEGVVIAGRFGALR